jgi:hypothetical protein
VLVLALDLLEDRMQRKSRASSEYFASIEIRICQRPQFTHPACFVTNEPLAHRDRQKQGHLKDFGTDGCHREKTTAVFLIVLGVVATTFQAGQAFAEAYFDLMRHVGVF